MTDFIIESKMRFIAEQAFHIEKSAAYKSVPAGIKTVEFIRRKKEKLFFIEAKTSYPNPSSDNKRYKEESSIIADKFVHSLNLLASISLGVKSDDITPLKNQTNKNSEITFLLVIHGHKTEWCANISEKLQQIVNENLCLQKIWRVQVLVINSELAVQKGFVAEIIDDKNND